MPKTTRYANRGRFFEQYLEHLHNSYRSWNRARIDFIPTPTKPHNERGRVVWTPTRKGIVDFVGVLPGGQFVAFDAKSTKNTKSWRVKTNRHSPRGDNSHQWRYLVDVHMLGGLAFYLIYAKSLDRVFIAQMPFLLEEAQRFANMVEVVKDEDGWWDWLRTLEQVGIFTPPDAGTKC